MKRLLLLLAATLPCFLALSQEAESVGSTAELTVIPYIEMIPNVTKNTVGFNFGNSSLFTNFSGNASEHFSWVLVNNWIGIPSEKGVMWDRYKNIGRSDNSDFILFCRGDFNVGGWTFSIGKDCMALGGFEYDPWDWDVQANFAAPLWRDLVCYQWGGKVAWSTPSEKTNLAIQMVSSPFGEYPFASGLWAYSGQWRGEYGWFSNIWSVSAVEYDRGRFDWLFCLGQRASFGDWTITLDYNNNAGVGCETPEAEESGLWRLTKGTTLAGTVAWAPLSKFDASLKGMWTTAGWQTGLLACFYPLKESQDLKIHAGLSFDTLYGANLWCLNLGVRYNIGIHLW